LTAYDLLGVLVPGIVVLVAVMGFLPDPPIPNDLGEYGLFTVFAFCTGALVQAHASEAVGPLETFDKTMGTVEVLSSLQYTVDGSETDTDESEANGGEDSSDESNRGEDASRGLEDSERGSSLWWQITHPVVGPLIGWRRPPRGNELEDRILANRIWQHLVDTHEIPFRTESYGVLYHVMSSEVDDISSPSRAVRMQAIRNFHRGMWIASWYATILLGATLIADLCFSVGESLYLGVTYTEPTYLGYWEPLWHLLLLSGGAVLAFWFLFESADEDYIEYLFADYAVAISSSATSVTLEDQATLELTGDFTTTISDDGQKDSTEPESIEDSDE
jgi:hypothetical protein